MFEKLNGLLDDPLFKSKVKYCTKVYQPQEKILKQGKMHQDIHLIKTGTARVLINADIEDDQFLKPGVADLTAGDVFGEFGLFDDLPASADVVAITECELINIDIQSFKTFLLEHPQSAYEILFDMIKTLIKRLRRANKAIYQLLEWGTKLRKIDQDLKSTHMDDKGSH